MADLASFDLKGLPQARAKVLSLANQVPEKVGAAMYQEMLEEQRESMERTPVETGALKSTHKTHKPVYQSGDISVSITVGGPAAGFENDPVGYAVYVHENLESYHRVGRAKYLESTLRESSPYMMERLARRLRGMGFA